MPIHCQVEADLQDFDGSWTLFESKSSILIFPISVEFILHNQSFKDKADQYSWSHAFHIQPNTFCLNSSRFFRSSKYETSEADQHLGFEKRG